MSDIVYTGLQLPNLSTGQARNASAGFVRLYFKNGNLYGVSATGVDTQLTGNGSLELKEISNVDPNLNPTDGQVLVWDNANGYWTADVTTVTFADIDAGSVLVSGETFDSQDDQLMSAAAIESYVTGLGYLTGVSQADVTQYEGALTITESQITFTSSFIELTDLSVTTAAASAGGSLTYTNTTGVFTYTPPDLSSFTTLTDFSVSEQTASGGGTLTYNNGSGLFTYTPPDLSSYTTLTDFSVTTQAASGGGTLSYNNTTGVYTYTPPDLSSYLTAEADTLQTVTGRGATTTNDITVQGTVTLDLALFPEQNTHPSFQEGLLWYDKIHKTLNYYSNDSNIIHELGIEEHQRVFNNTGSTIPKGAPLYFSGNYTAGEIDVPTVGLADGTSASAYNAQGLAGSDIPNNSYGYCIVAGMITGVNTTGLTAGQNFFVGLTPGAVQNASPSYPNYPMCLGWVVTSAVDGVLLVNQQNHSVNSFRVQGDTHIGGDLQVDGDFTVLGTQTIASSTNISIGGAFNYYNSGDTIGEVNTNFSGTGLDDAFFSGHYNGTAASTTYYVRIAATGTPDTFDWSLDNFSTTEATGVAITGDDQALQDGISINFGATTGHTVGDTWSGTAAPSNVDTGWVSNRNTGTTGVGYTHVGSFFDATDAKFRMFSAYDPEPTGTINIGHASYQTATLVANIEGDVTGVASSATVLQNSRNFSITGAVTAPNVGFTGAGDVTLTATLNSDLADLTDVSATAPTDGQVLTWNNATSVWEPADPSGGTGGTFQPVKLDAITTVNGQAAYTMQLSSVNYTPSSDFSLIVSLNGIIQEPGTAFSTTGSTITFVPALATGDVIDFIIDFGNAVDIGTITETDTLASVTARGNTTTENITAASFIRTGGTSSQFLKADGTVDSSTYLTSYTETDTLDSVTGRGATTTNAITVGSIDINGEIVELTRNATGVTGTTALDPALGTIQRLVLSGNVTFTDSLANGESITLMIDDGTGNTITWPTIAWKGGTAPTLDTANLTVIQVWKINNTLYGANVGVVS